MVSNLIVSSLLLGGENCAMDRLALGYSLPNGGVATAEAKERDTEVRKFPLLQMAGSGPEVP